MALPKPPSMQQMQANVAAAKQQFRPAPTQQTSMTGAAPMTAPNNKPAYPNSDVSKMQQVVNLVNGQGATSSPQSPVATSPVANYKGGANYNTANAAGRTAIAQNEANLSNPAFRQSELARTQQVLADMQKQGLNTDSQQKYLARLQGMGQQGANNGYVPGTNPLQDLGYGEQMINQQRNLAVESANQGAYDARNQSDVVSSQNMNAMKENMAALGLLPSGDYITSMAQGNAQRQGSLTDINNQLSENVRQLDIEKARQLQDNLYRNQDVDYRNRTFDWQKGMDVANLTGDYGGNRTLAGVASDQGVKVNNWNAYMDMVGQTQNLGEGPANTWKNLFTNAYGGEQTAAGRQDDRNFGYQVGRDKIGDTQWQQEFNQRKEQYGEQNALAWANQSLNQQQFSDDSAYKWAGLEYDISKPAGGAGGDYVGLNTNQVIDSVRSNYSDVNSLGENSGFTKDPKRREQAFLDVYNSLPPGASAQQAWTALGLTGDEVKSFKEKYKEQLTAGN